MEAVLEVLKKNWISFTCGLVALLAICSLGWPIAGMYKDLQKELDQRVSKGSSLLAVLSPSHNMPPLSPDNPGTNKLPVFPRADVIEAAKVAVNKIHLQADAMVQKEINVSRHSLLYPGVLPNPDPTTAYNFVAVYQQATTPDYARWKSVLNFGAHPSDDEIQKRSAALKDQILKRVFPDANGQPDPAASKAAEADYESRVAGLSQQIILEHAKNCSVYLEPGTVTFNTGINVNNGHALPQAGEIWDVHLQLWILDDIFKAIGQTNQMFADSDAPDGAPVMDVLHTPIKRIAAISPYGFVVSGDNSKAGIGSATPKIVGNSPTGRVSNGLYDVLSYRLTLDVDAAKLPQVCAGLEMGQFITVTNVQIESIQDPATAAQQGFLFGSKPVVRVQLDCEELLMKDWTNPILPDARKSAMGPVASAGGNIGNGGPGGVRFAPMAARIVQPAGGLMAPAGQINAPAGMNADAAARFQAMMQRNNATFATFNAHLAAQSAPPPK